MICRMCIVEPLNALNIFKCSSTKYKIADTITQHFGFQLLPDDPISNVICQTCWMEIENFHTYFVKVEIAQKQFTQLRLQTTIKQDDTLAIEEIKREYETDPIESILVANESWQTADLSPKKEDLDSEQEVDNNLGEEVDFSEAESTASTQLPILTTEAQQNIDSEIKENPTNSKTRSKVSAKQKSISKRQKLPKTKTDRAHLLDNVDNEIAKMMQLVCDQCYEKFDKFAQILQHFREAHKMRGYVVCCSKKFFQRYRLHDHLLKHYDPDRLKCEYCGKAFISSNSLQSHIQLKHSNNAKTLQCDKCPRRFLQEGQLRYHARIHLERESSDNFPCDDCGKVFKTSPALYSHRRSIHEQVYTLVCDICAKVMRRKIEFDQHMLEHKGVTEPMQKCTECNGWYKNAARLKCHQKSHAVDKERLTCRYCGKVMKTLLALRGHIEYVHEAKLQYKCVLCEKAFKRKTTLVEHMATHTGKELYNCPHCSKTFKSKANMHSHRKKVHRMEWEEARVTRGLPPEVAFASSEGYADS